jgi:Phage integrase family
MSPALAPASRRKAPPSYRFHQSSGQAVVTLNGKDFYLGTHGTTESRHAYAQLIAEWSASDRQIMPVGTEKQLLTVSHIIAGFLVHAEAYYVTYDGQPATELNSYRQALRPLEKLYGTRPARKFGPLALAATRQAMIEMGWARTRACNQTFTPPDHLCPATSPEGKRESYTAFIARLTPEARCELAKWRREHHWHPHQLRHNAATSIRREFGLEFSKVILGHRSLGMTEMYAEADQEKAQEVVRRIG